MDSGSIDLGSNPGGPVLFSTIVFLVLKPDFHLKYFFIFRIYFGLIFKIFTTNKMSSSSKGFMIMNNIISIIPEDYSITVESGCILSQVQDAAQEVSRFFPLSIGSEGSCTIGGNITTNAGGISVLKYGNMRDLVLGLEVVLADGRIMNNLKRFCVFNR